MTRSDCENLIEYLRAELAAYGTLVAHFERQKRALFLPEPDALLELTESIEQTVRETDAARTQREAYVRELASNAGLDEDVTMRELVPLAPAVFQPMLESFVREINRLIDMIRNRSQRNHQFLARTCQLHREALQSATQGYSSTTYGRGGRLQAAGGAAFQAAG